MNYANSAESQKKANESYHDDKVMNNSLEKDLYFQNKKCQFQNEAFYICSDKNCSYRIPFICRQNRCQCAFNHKKCQTNTISFVATKIQQQNNPKTLLERAIKQIMNQLRSDFISVEKQLIQLIQEGKADELFSKQQKKESQFLRYVCQELTGKKISELLSITEQSKSQEKFDDKVSYLKQKMDKFRKQRLDLFFYHLKEHLFLYPQPLRIEQKTVVINRQFINERKTKQNEGWTVHMLSPSVEQINAYIIKCRFKLESFSYYSAYIGIVLKEKLRRSTSNNKYLTQFGNFLQLKSDLTSQISIFNGPDNLNTIQPAFKLKIGDIIQIKLDKKSWRIQFFTIKPQKPQQQQKSSMFLSYQMMTMQYVSQQTQKAGIKSIFLAIKNNKLKKIKNEFKQGKFPYDI